MNKSLPELRTLLLTRFYLKNIKENAQKRSDLKFINEKDTALQRTDYVHLGYCYESAVKLYLKTLFQGIIFYKQKGGPGDGGIDLRGIWQFTVNETVETFPHSSRGDKDRLPMSHYVFVQCKHTKNQIPARLLHEFESSMTKFDSENIKLDKIGVFVATSRLSSHCRKVVFNMKIPMVFLQLIPNMNQAVPEVDNSFIQHEPSISKARKFQKQPRQWDLTLNGVFSNETFRRLTRNKISFLTSLDQKSIIVN